MEYISDMIGKTLTKVVNTGDKIIFTLDNGDTYKLCHHQDCCESVYVEDVIGDLRDLIGTPILKAEEVTSNEDPPGTHRNNEYRESFTWTFYHLATINGYVTIRFYGTSNGYYSESVLFHQC